MKSALCFARGWLYINCSEGESFKNYTLRTQAARSSGSDLFISLKPRRKYELSLRVKPTPRWDQFMRLIALNAD